MCRNHSQSKLFAVIKIRLHFRKKQHESLLEVRCSNEIKLEGEQMTCEKVMVKELSDAW